MTTYSCAFAFAGASVLLIRKAKPDWQRGLLNGIGGKKEGKETILQTTVREFREETGLWELDFTPKIYHSMIWPEYKTHAGYPLVYFSAFIIPPRAAAQAVQDTSANEEPCVLWPVGKIAAGMPGFMDNLPFLIEMAKALVLCTPDERRLRQPIVFDEKSIRDCIEYGAGQVQ